MRLSLRKESATTAFGLFKDKHWGRLSFIYDGGSKMRSIEYADIYELFFDAEVGLTIETSRWRIVLEGKNLRTLAEHLNDKKVGQVTANHCEERTTKPDDVFISSMVFDRVGRYAMEAV